MSYLVQFTGGAVEEVPTFQEALALYRSSRGASVFGSGYDCDSDEDGFFVCSDGLTEEERDALEEA